VPEVDLTQAANDLAHHALMWIGFGTLVGLLAKAIMPGRDPGGAIATLLMGIGGTIIGCAVLMYLSNGERVSPISPMGFLVGTAGSFMLLGFYRLLGGYFFLEGGTALRRPYYRGLRNRRRARNEIIIEE
jgi:uncharacterized membrane protein YeaQ/YmgE (transglycosylase-associated protein family)